MPRLPYQDADPAHEDFQYLEDLATGYWYSQVLFAALELNLFDALGREGKDLETLSAALECEPDPLRRLLVALNRLELVGTGDGLWFNSQISGRYLVKDDPSYMGDFFLYRRYMKDGWEGLFRKLGGGETPAPPPAPVDDTDYEARNFQYVRAMDTLARLKADEVAHMLTSRDWHPPLLDIGGGAGAFSRAILGKSPHGNAVLFELPEVIRAAKQLYPTPEAWSGITCLTGDFRSHAFDGDQRFGLIVMSNFLHAYGAGEARELLHKALGLMDPDGLLVIHDYFPDRTGRSPHKGALYDLTMMLNTYNGACHEAGRVVRWLEDAGFKGIETRDLTTDSTIIAAGGKFTPRSGDREMDRWVDAARGLGFRTAVPLDVGQVVTAPWVQMKCRFGCEQYGENLQCPPHSLPVAETEALLEAYHLALLVEDAPPGRSFHEKLLALERKAFLAGYHKAFVFGAGPCPICVSCPPEGPCRHTDLARPSMEGSGIDVYETARNAGVRLVPLKRKGQYVKYLGLLLLE